MRLVNLFVCTQPRISATERSPWGLLVIFKTMQVYPAPIKSIARVREKVSEMLLSNLISKRYLVRISSVCL